MINPLHDKVLVKYIVQEDKKYGGLYMPVTVEERILSGTVIAVGAGKYNPEGVLTPLKVQVNDEVMFDKMMGTEVKMDDDSLGKYIIIREHDVLGVMS